MKGNFSLSIDISEFDFTRESFEEISQNYWVMNQWPLIYFLQNKTAKIAYVGESANASNRINDHLKNIQRAAFTRVSIIGSDKFNKSATLTIESQLIQHISAEGSFLLQNGNNGLSYHDFYQRAEYEKQFKEIWARLIINKTVDKTIEEIQNSNFFKYSPYKSLTRDQYDSVLEIIQALNHKEVNHILVKGSAGTGKTILATYLIKLLTSKYEELNKEDLDEKGILELQLMQEFREKYSDPKIGLVIPMTSLRSTLQDVFDTIPGLKSSMVIGPSETFDSKKDYDILIVDEAHRLRQRKNISFMGAFTKKNSKLGLGNEGTELEWILANSKHQIFFYDAAQSVKPSDVPEEKFNALEKTSTAKLYLKSQMRVKAGPEYITFVDNLLHCRYNDINAKFEPLNYELKVFKSLKELYSELGRKEQQYKVCRLVAGYAWPWATKKKNSIAKHDIEIEGLKFAWNRTDKDWVYSATAFDEVGCLHTTQGYDINYTGVIFGREIVYNPVLKRIEIISENYHDRNGKAGITDPEVLKAYVINIYKTLMYRGAMGTYIYACDENLSNYLWDTIHSGIIDTGFKILPFDKVRPYINSVPIYDISVAAGNFSDPLAAPNLQWVQLPEPYTPAPDYFVCRVQGESMNKIIPSGSWCLFKNEQGGSRENKIVLVSHNDIQDADFGTGYTVKSYHSSKIVTEEGWFHTGISLKPLSNNPVYKDIVLSPENGSIFNVLGIFVDVLR